MASAERMLSVAKLMEKYAKSVMEGRPIRVEYYVEMRNRWIEGINPTFNLSYEWREKPEPRRIYVTYSPEGFILGIGQKDKYIEKGLEVVEFVEKIQ